MHSARQEEALSKLIEDSIQKILADEDPERFFMWIRSAFSTYRVLPADRELDEEPLRALAMDFGREIWNATPLPGNGFEPRVLQKPSRNQPCPCGAGKKYKRCCGRFDVKSPIEFGRETLAPFVLNAVSAEQRAAMIAADRAPVELIAETAREQLEAGHPGKAARCLEPVFERSIDRPTEAHAYALHVLSTAYEELGHNKKLTKLIRRLANAPESSWLRAEARVRIADELLGARDLVGSRDALTGAMRDNPEADGLGILEVSLLFCEGRADDARQRARYWLLRLGGDPLRRTERELIERVVDLRRRLESFAGFLGQLESWFESVADRPIPLCQLIEETGGSESPEDESQAEASMWILATSTTNGSLEQGWRDCFFAAKPFGTQNASMEEEDPWDADRFPQWMAYLSAHPEAADSLDILDDLATALLEQESQPNLCGDILERAVEIVRTSLDAVPDVTLDWGMRENRPALRPIARLFDWYGTEDGEVLGLELAKYLLRVSPGDSHGMRSVVMNCLLREDDDEEAWALATRYSDDFLADIVFGRILACLRTGRLEEAETVFREAAHRSKVPQYLLSAGVSKPEIHGMGITLGGDDEAWLYREEMRGEWERSAGALPWLARAMQRAAGEAGPRVSRDDDGHAIEDVTSV